METIEWICFSLVLDLKELACIGRYIMAKLLWEPSKERKMRANVSKFMDFVNKRYGLQVHSYGELHDWSVKNIPDFWESVWDFCGVKASKSYDKIVEDLDKFPGARWLAGARLNYAENLLRHRDDRTAIIFKGEAGQKKTISYKELYDEVARLAKSLREAGVHCGDRVAGYMPNIIETAVAMLASTSIGAIWSSCGTELGPDVVLDRLGQIEPKVLFTVDGYFYKGKPFNSLPRASEIVRKLPSVEKVVIVPYIGQPETGNIPNSVMYGDFIAKDSGLEIQFEQLPSDHPLFIVFSSGTTGKPKCIVHSHGGVLLMHLKTVSLHYDIQPDDKVLFITSPSWILWNVQIANLTTGAPMVLFDGNPFYPDMGAMWKLIQDERLTFFMCSAIYLNTLKIHGIKPREKFDLSSLRSIFYGGSALSPEGYEYVYEEIKPDVCLLTGLGGTDLHGGLLEATPIQPVYAGQIQGPGLGMKVKAYDEKGKEIYDKPGELVCEAPFPSVPIYFWNDPDGKRFKEAYFSVYPNVWRHGDYVIFHSDTGGITALGRSDAVLKPSGVRIGPGEVYRALEGLEEVVDSMVIGQSWQGDQRLILFVKLKDGLQLTKELEDKITRVLREKASPRHVPDKILQVPDIPYTFTMKKVEVAVNNIVHGRPVTNRDALVNPECLDYYEDLVRKGILSE